MRPIHVAAMGLWSPGFARLEDWLAGRRDERVTSPACELVPPRQRRATSLATRMGLEVLGQVLGADGVERSRTRLVFGSAYGEFETALCQLDMMATDDGRLSPARFKNSVHNTVIGLLSIALENRAFSTAIAAGEQTFAMSLLEAWSLLALEGGSAAVAVADVSPEEPFRPGDPFPALGVALRLTADPAPESSMATLHDLRRRKAGSCSPEALGGFEGNPAARALPLIRAIAEGRSGSVALEDGAAPWTVQVEAPSRGDAS